VRYLDGNHYLVRQTMDHIRQKMGDTELVEWPGTDSPSPNLQSASPSVLDCSRLFVLRTFMADKILRSVKRYYLLAVSALRDSNAAHGHNKQFQHEGK
jgi:hypothetical protein